jgi:flavin-dependent dehydrogenase
MSQRDPGGRYDALVVGARCAGAATALFLARRGLRVLAVDRSPYRADTLSTHALMRAGVLQLARLGVLPRLREAGTPAVRTTWFHYGDEAVEIPIKAREGVDALYAPRRTVLDAFLVDAAREAGVEFRHGATVVELLRSPGERTRGVVIADDSAGLLRVEADIVIGADGLRSTVARLLQTPVYREGRHACTILYGYWSDLPVEGFRWYYRPGASAGAIPTNDGQVCLFVAAPAQRFPDELRADVEAGYHRLLHEAAPEMAEAVTRAGRVSGLRGFPGHRGFFRQSFGPGWALVGDAGYFRDPLTAHGMTDALRDAELLARAVNEGTDRALAGYQEARDDLARGLFEASDEIASFSWDLERVKERHLFMSREMNREFAALVGLDGQSTPARGGQAA